MKKLIIIASFFLITATLIVLFNSFNTEEGIYSDEFKLLGYCPSMESIASALKEDHKVELVKFNSASEVFNALNKGDISLALVGRKAEVYEKNENLKEIVLISGFTLVSNRKYFIDFEDLHSLEIITYLPEENVSKLCPVCSVIYEESKEEALKKATEGKAVLVSWDDWEDYFELIVVMNDFEKDKNFRGAFLYSY